MGESMKRQSAARRSAAPRTDRSNAFEDDFRRLKKCAPGALLLWECGDYYTAFYSDAEIVGNILGVLVAHNLDGRPEPITPTRSRAEENIQKLTCSGWRIAIIARLPSLERGRGPNSTERVRVSPGK